MTPTTKPCPECGEEMTHEDTVLDYGADADGNRGVTLPGGWWCECGNFEKDEPNTPGGAS